jgi:hypothetical protein
MRNKLVTIAVILSAGHRQRERQDGRAGHWVAQEALIAHFSRGAVWLIGHPVCRQSANATQNCAIKCQVDVGVALWWVAKLSHRSVLMRNFLLPGNRIRAASS